MFVNLSAVNWAPNDLNVSQCVWVFEYLQQLPQLKCMEILLGDLKTLGSLKYLPTGLKSCRLILHFQGYELDQWLPETDSLNVPQITAMKVNMSNSRIDRLSRLFDILYLPNLKCLNIKKIKIAYIMMTSGMINYTFMNLSLFPKSFSASGQRQS